MTTHKPLPEFVVLAGISADDWQKIKLGRRNILGKHDWPNELATNREKLGKNMRTARARHGEASSKFYAASRGLGVVATPVGGNPEMLPGRCLVPADDVAAVADAMAVQGLDPGVRPGLAEWPTVAEMSTRIGAVYDSVCGVR